MNFIKERVGQKDSESPIRISRKLVKSEHNQKLKEINFEGKDIDKKEYLWTLLIDKECPKELLFKDSYQYSS